MIQRPFLKAHSFTPKKTAYFPKGKYAVSIPFTFLMKAD
jgi:hypothetical protein